MPKHFASISLESIQRALFAAAIGCRATRNEDLAVTVGGRLKNTAVSQEAGLRNLERPRELGAVSSRQGSDSINDAALVPSYEILLPMIGVVHRALAKITITIVVLKSSILPVCRTSIPVHCYERVLLFVALTGEARVASCRNHLVGSRISDE